MNTGFGTDLGNKSLMTFSCLVYFRTSTIVNQSIYFTSKGSTRSVSCAYFNALSFFLFPLSFFGGRGVQGGGVVALQPSSVTCKLVCLSVHAQN
jgi:hypothetical protein